MFVLITVLQVQMLSFCADDDIYPGVYFRSDVIIGAVEEAMRYTLDQGVPPQDIHSFLLMFIDTVHLLVNETTSKNINFNSYLVLLHPTVLLCI